jgi:hypothetical protein
MLSLSSHKLVDVCAHYGISITSAHRASGDVEALAKVMPYLIADAERLHGIRTWGDLQRFLQKPSKTPAPSAAGRTAAGVAGGGGVAVLASVHSSPIVSSSVCCQQHQPAAAAAAALPIVAAPAPAPAPAPVLCGGGGGININLINNAKDVTLPKPYDAAAPCGQHPWDTPHRKWNGNLCVICPHLIFVASLMLFSPLLLLAGTGLRKKMELLI